MELAEYLASLVGHETTASEAIAAVKQLLQQDRVNGGMCTDPIALHAALYQRWTQTCDLPTTSYVTLVTGCDLTAQLRRTLQDMHVLDALDDMQDIMHCITSDDHYFASSLDVMPLIMDVLLPVAVMFAWRTDHDRRVHLIKTIEKHNASCCGIHQAIETNRLLRHSGDEDEESTGRWDQFCRLPTHLDERKFQSKNGRMLINAVKQIVEQQQFALSKKDQLKCDDFYDEDIDKEESLEQMCDVAVRALDYITKECNNGKCIHEGELHADEALQAVELNLVDDDLSLEEYLKDKRRCGQSEYEVAMISPVEDELHVINTAGDKTTSIQQLVASWDSDGSNTRDLDGVMLSVQQELLSIREMKTLSIHVGFLLAARERCDYDWSNSFASGIERQVQKILNSLASDPIQELEHVRSLVVLAAFSPARVIQEIVRGASLSSQHHDFYSKVLHSLPLLIEWQVEDSKSQSEFTHQARLVLEDLVSDEVRFESRSVAFLKFCCSLAGLSAAGTASKAIGALVSLDLWIHDVVLPVYINITMKQTKSDAADKTRSTNTYNNFQLLYQLTERAISSQACWKLNSTQDLLSRVLKAYTEIRENASFTKTKQLDLLLLTLKNAMEMIARCENPVLPDICDDVWNRLDARCLELFAPLCSAEDSRFKTNVNKVMNFVREKKSAECDAMISKDDAADVMEKMLWRLLWNSMYSPQLTSSACFKLTLSSDAVWEIIDWIAHNDTGTFSSPNIIQKEVAKMLLACGSSLFVVAYECVLPFLLKYEIMANGKQCTSQLMLPRFLAKPQELEESIWNAQIDCFMLSTHYVTNMVIRYWREQTSGSSTDQDVRLNLVTHILECNNRSVTSSSSSLPGLLLCFQQLCFTVAFASEHLRDSLDRYPAVQSQLNLALLRLLHLIGRANASHAAEASFSAHFVACWLGILPAGSYDEASRFLQSAQTA